MGTLPLDPYLAADAFPSWLSVYTLTPLVFALYLMVYFWRQRNVGSRYLKKQSDYLDHQKVVNEKALLQNKTFEEMTANQYRENNDRTDRALAQSDEAIRLHAASLEQLASMNQALTRLAHILEAGNPPVQPGAPAA